MKTRILILTLFVLTASCVDLEEDPVQQLQTEYFRDLNSLRTAVSGTYRMLITDNWEKSVQVGSFRVPLNGADDFTTIAGGNKEDWRQFDQFYASSGNSRLFRATWDLLYDVIRQASWDIEGARGISGVEQAEIDAIVAESHFLRGRSYFWLVRTFGGVPLIDYTTFSEDIYNVRRGSVEETYELILRDLEFAAEHLPETQPDYGMVNRWAAKAYLAEVHLTMAGWPLKQTSHYADAASYAKDILDNGPFMLMEDYGSLFQMANEANAEFLWSIPLCAEGDCGNGFQGSFMAKASKPSELQGWEDMIVELSFFERFPEGARKDFSILSRLRVESNDSNDPSYTREDGTVVHYTYEDYTQFSSGHPFMKKYWDGFYDSTLVANDPMQNVTSLSSLDMSMMRLAKVMLMYAEAQAMADGAPSSESYEYLNQIRRRGKGYDPFTTGSDVDIAVGTLSAEEFAREVVDEKGWELFGELNRWFDLTRTELVEEMNALRSPNEILPIQNEITKDRYYAPIPATEIELNPNLEQNPGYE
jgi:hypothetical protein